jgi:hypothetical protein
MGVMIGVGIVVLSIIGGSISQLLAEEFKSWAPRIANRVILYAVFQLPTGLRERLGEEWRGFIEETPGSLGKIFSALGFVRASLQIRLTPRKKFYSIKLKLVAASLKFIVQIEAAHTRVLLGQPPFKRPREEPISAEQFYNLRRELYDLIRVVLVLPFDPDKLG